jgi:hypothetical protein
VAFPFGGHPSFAQYIQWAVEQEKCEVRSGIVNDEKGRPHSVTQIIAPSKKWVTVVGTQHSEYLVPTMIAYLDRRLGIKSPFFSLDFPEMDPDQGHGH